MKNLIIISAPSGAGKTTLCRALQKEMNDIQWSISYTTRMKRKMEKNGTDYHFISISKFQALIKNNSFAEWERVHGHYYGTEKRTLEIAISKNRILLIFDSFFFIFFGFKTLLNLLFLIKIATDFLFFLE